MLATLTRLFPLWALLLSVLAYYTPTTFTPIGPWVTTLLMLIMFGMGVHLKLEDFKRVLSRPAPVAAGIFLHYLVMPLAAWLLALLVHHAAGAFRRDGAGRQRRQRDRLQRDDLSCQRGCGAVGDHLLGLHPSSASWRHRCSPVCTSTRIFRSTSWACCSAFYRLWSFLSRWD